MLHVDYGEGVVEEGEFELPVFGGVGGHGWTPVDFDEPGL